MPAVSTKYSCSELQRHACSGSGSGGLSGGAIAGIVVGALAVLAVLLAVLGAHQFRRMLPADGFCSYDRASSSQEQPAGRYGPVLCVRCSS